MTNVPEVMHLPPQETPKQLSGNFRPENLKEHMLSFLAANNKSGYVSKEEEIKTASTVSEIIYQYLLNETTNLEHFYKVVDEIELVGNISHTNKNTFNARTRYLLAKVFGYCDFKHLLNANDLYIRNDLDMLKPFSRIRKLETIPTVLEGKHNPYYIELQKSAKKIAIDRDYAIKTIATSDPKSVEFYLAVFAARVAVTRNEFKRDAKHVKEIAEGKIKLGNALNLLALAFGYKHYTDAMSSEMILTKDILININKRN